MAAYFGRPWPSGICEDPGAMRVPTPLLRRCWWCQTRIWWGHQGSFIGGERKNWRRQQVGAMLPVHKECSLRSVIGGIFHVRGDCQYTGHCEELREQQGLSRRQDAVLTWTYVQQYGLGNASVH